ncbi:anti-sigma-I factor RsgI family protein [Caproicibacter fermentans]|uniref:RsgI N-terminal anti-sigma domain-containing protein n=1 Tax=Caproicibacter fermentans TaxID=2576756 RepID=A0A7G8TD30_9FIRM|nr:hypothetical protein [Caproicibacter fermentans]QNK41521.1 hypothetical protein HCR03_04450 [Caproicibacter fermentans]
MKGVIVEIRGAHAAALSDDGCIIKVKDRNYAIGQVIEMKKQVFGNPAKTMAITVAAALTLMFGVSAWAYCTPCIYVSLDVNPSIEYSVNRFGRVLSAKAVDQDAVKVLEQLNLQNQSIDEAVRSTVQQISQEGYFQSDDPGGIMIATYSDNETSAEKLATNLKDTAEQEVDDAKTPVDVESVSVGYERVQEARALDTTPGKLNLVEKLQASTGDPSSVDVTQWLRKPVKDIMKAIKETKKASGDDDAEDVQNDTGTDGDSASSSPETASSEDSAQPRDAGRILSADQAKRCFRKQSRLFPESFGQVRESGPE